jgi:hypothetical protein
MAASSTGEQSVSRKMQLARRTRKSSFVLGASTVDTVVLVGTVDEKPSADSDTNNSISDFRAAVGQSFDATLDTFTNCKTIRLLAEGDFTLDQQRSVLREFYYYVREDPQIEPLVYLRGKDRNSVKGLSQHAISEIGHEELWPSTTLERWEEKTSA